MAELSDALAHAERSGRRDVPTLERWRDLYDALAQMPLDGYHGLCMNSG